MLSSHRACKISIELGRSGYADANPKMDKRFKQLKGSISGNLFNYTNGWSSFHPWIGASGYR
jgi:hypothetical protein